MPIYEFRCDSCQQVFEHLAMGQGDGFEAKCPHCGGKELSRVMSSCASVVSGSAGGGESGATLENRSCGKENSCTTLTLPGYTR